MVESTIEMSGAPTEVLAPGTRVDVRNRYVGAWSHGFEVAEHLRGDGYRIRRLSDGSVLPEPLSADEVRPERRKRGMWWY
ncbi:MAG TPA: hypothetical protein VMR97_00440 [Acidimicrobiales bacterium]|nr:hypothetical protein [Acidimicrobiales bacterium]